MGGRVVSSLGSCKHRRSFTSVLASALLEWVLIFLLFVYGIFGYLITKFASYCELPIPCLLCSRIDNTLGGEKDGFYWDMICGNHKMEISSLVYCHFHEKLVDVRGMCESCLFSFATKDKSNAETYRLLVGKLGEEDLGGFDEDPLVDDDISKSLKHCSCCNALWTPRRPAQTLLQTRSVGFDAAELGIPLSRELSNNHDELVKEAQIHSKAATTHVGGKTEKPLVDFGYTELKITSDTESDIQASDNEDTKPLISDDPLRDLILVQMESLINLSEYESAINTPADGDVLSHRHSETLSDLVPVDIIQSHNVPSIPPAPAIGHGLEELEWQEIDLKPDTSISTELIDMNDHKKKSSASTEPLNDNHGLDIQNSGGLSTDSSKDGLEVAEAGVLQSSETNNPLQESCNAPKLGSLNNSSDLNTSETKIQCTDGGSQMPDNLDLSDAYKLAVGLKGRQLSEKLTERLGGKDSQSVSADIKLLLSQYSRGFDIPPAGILSPRLSKNTDELKTLDSTTSVGIKLLQKRLSLERNDSKNSLDRNESGVESLDWSIVSEIDGESELDRSKRQLEHDRRFMIALLKELEEERSASASAANEAMAMITRLQEEKAALQMEASHDLRMMEEQAEFDMDALEKINDLVTEKEKEIQDLEGELEYYRTKYPNKSFVDYIGELTSDVSRQENQRSALDHSDIMGEIDSHNSKDPPIEMEDKMEYLAECLRKLEEKLRAFCSNVENSNLTNGGHLENQGNDSSDSDLCAENGAQVEREIDENSMKLEKDLLKSDESLQNLIKRVNSFKEFKSTGIHEEANLAAVVNEVSKLSERLQALEADRSFMGRVISTLENGEEGLIQEIASHLRELRKIGIRIYQPSLEDTCIQVQR